MKIIKLIIIFLLSIDNLYAQTSENRAVIGNDNLLNFQEIQASGLPNINIPLFKVETRNNILDYDLTLNYNPKSVAYNHIKSGEFGKGWTSLKSGIIHREINNRPFEIYSQGREKIYTSEVYNFSLLNLNHGKFHITRYKHSGIDTLKVDYVKNDLNEILKMDLDYDPTTLNINSFTIYDERGLKYVYDIFENFNIQSVEYRVTHFLSKVFDSNNNLILDFIYDDDKNLTQIKSIDLGTVNLSYNNLKYCKSIKYYNIFNKLIQSYDFEYVSGNINYNHIDYRLLSTIKNLININDITEFSYGNEFLQESFNDFQTFDKWGFPAWYPIGTVNVYEGGASSHPTPNHSVFGSSTLEILNSIKNPIKGTTKYNYELNTYSYNTKGRELVQQDGGLINYNNLHNYNIVSIVNDYKNNNSTFTITESGSYYINFFTPKGIDSVNPPNNGPGWIVDEDGNIFIDTRISLFLNNQRYTTLNRGQFNLSTNGGFGIEMQLEPGTYRISHNYPDSSVWARINQINLKPDLNYYLSGAGVRINSIEFFDKYVNFRSIPKKTIKYKYNNLENSKYSSGVLLNEDISNLEENYLYDTHVIYKDITIESSDYKGKITNTYLTPINFEFPEETPDYQIGKIKSKKTYDELGNLVKSSDYSYILPNITYYDTTRLDTITLYPIHKVGSIFPSKIINKEYYGQNFLKTEKKYQYSGSKLTETSYKDSNNNINIKYKYYYNHIFNNLYKNFHFINKIESYNNDVLTKVNLIDYKNNWDNIENSSTIAYLPHISKVSKNNIDFIDEQIINKHDRYNNIIEYTDKDNIKIVNIWGYNNTLLVAKIKNCSLSEISENLIYQAKEASDLNDEVNLVNALQNIRTSLINTNKLFEGYTYIPLIGISKYIDANGNLLQYMYNNQNQLFKIIDNENNTIKEVQFNLRSLE